MASMHERREHPRIPLRVKIKIAHPDFGEKLVLTKNFSEGAYLSCSATDGFTAPGAIVKGQIQDLPEAAPLWICA